MDLQDISSLQEHAVASKSDVKQEKRSIGTQTDIDTLHIYAERIVRNYKKIEKAWERKERRNHCILTGCFTTSLVIILALGWKRCMT